MGFAGARERHCMLLVKLDMGDHWQSKAQASTHCSGCHRGMWHPSFCRLFGVEVFVVSGEVAHAPSSWASFSCFGNEVFSIRLVPGSKKVVVVFHGAGVLLCLARLMCALVAV